MYAQLNTGEYSNVYTGESGNVHVQMKPRTQSHLSTLGMEVPQEQMKSLLMATYLILI